MNSEGLEQSVNNTEDIVFRPISEHRKQVGKNLYIAAWVVEAWAVFIGLGIAVMQYISSFDQMYNKKEGVLGFGDYTNAVIAAVPFVMVSVIELTKIPFVDAFYNTTSRLWKAIFLFSLIFIAFITFESAANGFERNFNALNYSIDDLKRALVAVEEKIPPLEKRRKRAAGLTAEKIEADYNERYQALSSERASQSITIEDRKSGLRASIQSEYSSSLLGQIETLRNEVQTLRDQRQRDLDSLFSRSQVEVESATSRRDAEIRQLAQDYEREQARLESLQAEAQQKVNDANFFNRGAVKEDYEQRIKLQENKIVESRDRLEESRGDDLQGRLSNNFRFEQDAVAKRYEDKIGGVQSRIDALTEEYNLSIGTRENDVERTIATYDDELELMESNFADQLAESQSIRESELLTLDNNQKIIGELQAQIDNETDLRTNLREQINKEVGDNQIYRTAQMFYGTESAADLGRDQVMNVAMIWFGSLAALVAFTGIMLAMAAAVIRDPRLPDYRLRSKRPIRRQVQMLVESLRRFMVQRRRMQRKPIIKEVITEITNEVPVDRVVKVEVPVEIVKKEIVHVPFYTNDQKLLNLQNNDLNEAELGKD